VEGGDVLGLELGKRDVLAAGEEGGDQVVRLPGRNRRERRLELAVSGAGLRVRVLEQQREQPVGAHDEGRFSLERGTKPLDPPAAGWPSGCGKPPPPCAWTRGPAVSECPFGIT